MSTAIIGQYTPEGFVVASDGLSTRPDGSIISTNTQKIFPVEHPGIRLVYAVMGNPVITEDATGVEVMNLPVDIGSRCDLLASEPVPPSSLVQLANTIFLPVIASLRAARERGTIAGYPSLPSYAGETGDTIARIVFAGYFNKVPSLAVVRLFHVDGKLEGAGVMAREIGVGFHYGSDKVAELIQHDHPYFKRYKVPYGQSFGLDGTVRIARNCIEAYGDPEAHKIDPAICSAIGGETQVCMVTPDRIEWIKAR